MYVAVKGGERAIAASHAVLAEARRGDPAVPVLSVAQIENQLGHAVDRVMAEGALYDRTLAALAIKQAQGDLQEAAFLLRAYRTTLPRFCSSVPIDTARMTIARRISATYKDLPGGQILGPTCDYTHRLLDAALLEDAAVPPAPRAPEPADATMPRVTELLDQEGLIRREQGDRVAQPPDSHGVDRDVARVGKRLDVGQREVASVHRVPQSDFRNCTRSSTCACERPSDLRVL